MVLMRDGVCEDERAGQSHTHTSECATAALRLCRRSGRLKELAAAETRKRSEVTPRPLVTHVDARGVKRTLVCDAEVADGVGEAAMGQEVPPVPDGGAHRGHGESDGRGRRRERRGQADRQQRPRLEARHRRGDQTADG